MEHENDTANAMGDIAEDIHAIYNALELNTDFVSIYSAIESDIALCHDPTLHISRLELIVGHLISNLEDSKCKISYWKIFSTNNLKFR